MGVIRAVGFDLDGTLFDHRGSASIAVDTFYRSLGVEPSEKARNLWFAAEEDAFELWRSGRISFQDQRRRRLRTVLPAVGLSTPRHADGLDRLFSQYLRAYRAAGRPFADSASILGELGRMGLSLGILTNGAKDQQMDKLQVSGLSDLVDVVLISEELGFQKPDQQAFQALTTQLAVAPSECLFIGDNFEHDIAGARAAGLDAVLINRYDDTGLDLRTALWDRIRP